MPVIALDILTDIYTWFQGLFDFISGMFATIGDALIEVKNFLTGSYSILGAVMDGIPYPVSALVYSVIIVSIILLIWPGGGGGD